MKVTPYNDRHDSGWHVSFTSKYVFFFPDNIEVEEWIKEMLHWYTWGPNTICYKRAWKRFLKHSREIERAISIARLKEAL